MLVAWPPGFRTDRLQCLCPRSHIHQRRPGVLPGSGRTSPPTHLSPLWLGLQSESLFSQTEVCGTPWSVCRFIRYVRFVRYVSIATCRPGKMPSLRRSLDAGLRRKLNVRALRHLGKPSVSHHPPITVGRASCPTFSSNDKGLRVMPPPQPR